MSDSCNDLLMYINDHEVEPFSPKPSRNPADKKRKNAKHSRTQMAKLIGKKDAYPPHHVIIGLSENGIPYYINRLNANRRIYRANGWNRPRHDKYLRKRNGSVEFGPGRDVWSKPHVERKSSRVYMNEIREWWEEAYETLHENGAA